MGFTGTYKYYKDTKNFHHQPSIRADTSVILEKFPLRATNVICNVYGISINSLNRFALLGDHRCQLSENLTELSDSGFDRCDSC